MSVEEVDFQSKGSEPNTVLNPTAYLLARWPVEYDAAYEIDIVPGMGKTRASFG